MVEKIKSLNKPTLGICVGMQLLTSYSEEGDAEMLNIFPVKTLKFADSAEYKVPHTGWNQVNFEKENALFKIFPLHHTFTLYIHTLLSLIRYILWHQQPITQSFRHQFGWGIFMAYNFTLRNQAGMVSSY